MASKHFDEGKKSAQYSEEFKKVGTPAYTYTLVIAQGG